MDIIERISNEAWKKAIIELKEEHHKDSRICKLLEHKINERRDENESKTYY